jgi:hypothetical protein
LRPNIFASFKKAANRRRRVWALLITFLLFGEGCASSDAQYSKSNNERMTKIGPELITLYDEYSSYIASGKRGVFKSSSPLVRLLDDRVVIDAVASGDPNVLKSDLEVLGMQQAVTFGRVVSGQLPILAIRSMAGLPSLNSARAATAVLQGAPRAVLPGTPNQ